MAIRFGRPIGGIVIPGQEKKLDENIYVSFDFPYVIVERCYLCDDMEHKFGAEYYNVIVLTFLILAALMFARNIFLSI